MNTDETTKENHLVKHLVLRLLNLVIPAIALFAVFNIMHSDSALLLFFAAIYSPLIGFVFLIIESIFLHLHKKTELRNVNLIMIAVFIPVYIILVHM